MTKKIKIPQEVADAIEKLKGLYTNYGVVTAVEKGGSESLSESRSIIFNWTHEETDDGMNADRLLEVLVNGYEVEPEPLKAGDWAKHETKDRRRFIGKIHNIDNEGKVWSHWNGEKHAGFIYLKDLEKMTPEEIKVEKARRKWGEIGREPYKVKDGDVFVLNDSTRDVIRCRDFDSYELESMLLAGDIKGFYPDESFVTLVGESND